MQYAATIVWFLAAVMACTLEKNKMTPQDHADDNVDAKAIAKQAKDEEKPAEQPQQDNRTRVKA